MKRTHRPCPNVRPRQFLLVGAVPPSNHTELATLVPISQVRELHRAMCIAKFVRHRYHSLAIIPQEEWDQIGWREGYSLD